MARFRCIGSSCEASCCQGGWDISIDRAHYDKAKDVMRGVPGGRQEFDAKFQRVRGVARSNKHHALMVLQNNGDCSFLDRDKLCGLQKRFGEDVLSDTCAVYPRAPSLSGTRHEMAGVASCPEVARQLLLHADAFDLDEVPASTFLRSGIHQKLPAHPEQPYLRYHDELRNLVLDVLSDTLYPLDSRLFIVAYFANRTLEFLHREVQTLDETRLEAEVVRVQNPELRKALHERFQQLTVEAALPSRIVLALATGRARTGEFGRLVTEVFEGYGGSAELAAGAQFEHEAERLLAAYTERKRAWSAFQPRIDLYLMNFTKNFWVREWYAKSPNLLVHHVQVLTHVAALRFFLYGHPDLAAAQHGEVAQKEAALDRAVVDVVHKFSRAIDHDVPLRRALQEQLMDNKLVSLAHAACLAGF
jgi:lysine-N-methylase